MSQKFSIFALSDATGELAYNFSVAAVNQFPSHNSKIIRVPKITRKEQIENYVIKARECLGVIVFTFVKTKLRHAILDLAAQHQVVVIDVMGPALDSLSNYFHTLPSDEPGLQYKQTRHYYKRIEALEFTVKHDDGLGLEDIHLSDIVLLGISRTSKTPLAIFLAYHGYCCANVPIVRDLPLPQEVEKLDKSRIVGITIDANHLATIRSTRMVKLGRSETELYSDLSRIEAEIQHANLLYQKMKIAVVDISGKAIEEIASEVIALMTEK
ncbi:MAG: kinase/pyrophosphorylase [Deltaproteobacteria bacterium]|nr:kinase/pyrophosphorylase [Deltaproteobacteria bacterium]